MTDQPQEQTSQVSEDGEAVELRLVPADFSGAPLMYANFIQGTAAQHDMTLYLGWYSTPPFGGEKPTEPVDIPVRPLASVTVPISLVPGLIRVLQAQLSVHQAAAELQEESE